MKKTIIYLLTILLFASCNNSNTITISQEEYKQLKGDTIKPEYPKEFSVNNTVYHIYLGSDKHEYYGFRIGTGGYSSEFNYVHYHDCVKCKKDTL